MDSLPVFFSSWGSLGRIVAIGVPLSRSRRVGCLHGSFGVVVDRGPSGSALEDVSD
jgi:hypothetical protein